MKIQNDDGVSRGLSHSTPAVQGSKVDGYAKVNQGKPSTEDRVELSDRARAMQVASVSLKQTEEIRTDKVEHLKSLIKQGKYQVPAQDIAERMLGEGLFA